MSEQEQSVSEWIEECRRGDDRAAARLWDRYFRRMVGLARARLQTLQRRAADEEDVALSAFAAFCRAMRDERYPDLKDRDDLWRVLVVFTCRKAGDLIDRETAGRRPRTEGETGLAQAADRKPPPDVAAEIAEQFQVFLSSVEDERMLEAAVLRMEGHKTTEIAERLGVAPPTARHWLALLRAQLEEQMGGGPEQPG
jgi:DNA-directed RNA polymerase specialized sigma24 family protein